MLSRAPSAASLGHSDSGDPPPQAYNVRVALVDPEKTADLELEAYLLSRAKAVKGALFYFSSLQEELEEDAGD